MSARDGRGPLGMGSMTGRDLDHVETDIFLLDLGLDTDLDMGQGSEEDMDISVQIFMNLIQWTKVWKNI